MGFQHVGHPVIRRGADGGHGGLGFLIGLDADFVDAVGHVLLLGGFQRLGQRVIQDDPLLGVGLQLVDQHHLGRGLVLQAVDPGLAGLDIAFQRLRFRQRHLFVLDQRVMFLVGIRQFGFQPGAVAGIGGRGDLVFQLDQARVHRLDPLAQRFQRVDGGLAFVERAGQVGFDPGLLFVQLIQLTLQQLGDDIGFADQVLQFVVDRRAAQTFLTHRFRLACRKDADEFFPAGL